jgi:hypothetical protein
MKSVWIGRIFGILLLIGFIVLLVHMKHQLEDMQRDRRPAATSTR